MHDRLAAALVLLAGVSVALWALTMQAGGAAAARDATLKPEALYSKSFRFSWKTERGSGNNGVATLRKDGTIAGVPSPNETFWLIDGAGRLVFKHRDGRISTVFSQAEQRQGRWLFAGPFQFREGVTHVLEEVPAEEASESADELLNRAVRPYSSQQIVCLNPDETYRFVPRSGAAKTIRLVSVQEHRDSVNRLMRRADVRVEIDGRPLDLVCAPYVMPTETGGLRIQADTTSGWAPQMPKKVQFSLWDAAAPIVDTKRFGFPIRNYRLFSHGMQAFNEALHLGRGDGDPAGLKGYHDYGFDMAGYEGGEEVVSAAEGKLVKFWPNRENFCGVNIEDAQGLTWRYVHLASLAPGLVLGSPVAKGQKIGMLGKTGPSGNFSHLHLSREGNDKRLNLYPWVVTAYQAEHPRGLFAVARPHVMVRTGERAVLDGSNSLAFGGKIVEWRWVFHDGQTVREARAEKVFDKPGAYVAALWVKDDKGAEDVDFCQVKVFSAAAPESVMPHLFMTHTPTEDIRPEQPMRLRLWFQGKGSPPIQVDFDDGTHVADYQSYAELTHSFKMPGIHIVTAQTTVDGTAVMQKQKIVVGR